MPRRPAPPTGPGAPRRAGHPGQTGAIETIPAADPTGPDAFEVFYRSERAAVCALAYSLSGSRPAAEDLAQEAFLATHRRFADLHTPEAYVRRVVMNLAAGRVRRLGAESRALRRLAGRRDDHSATTDFAELRADDAGFWRAVASLPHRQAQVVALRYLEDRPVAEIAALLEVSDGTVKAALHKARRRLARTLDLSLEDDS